MSCYTQDMRLPKTAVGEGDSTALLEELSREGSTGEMSRFTVQLPTALRELINHPQSLGLPERLSASRVLVLLASLGERVLNEQRDSESTLALYRSYGDDPEEMEAAEENLARALHDGIL